MPAKKKAKTEEEKKPKAEKAPKKETKKTAKAKTEAKAPAKVVEPEEELAEGGECMLPGDFFRCEECGMVVVVDETCECASCDITCCGIPMAPVRVLDVGDLAECPICGMKVRVEYPCGGPCDLICCGELMVIG